MKTAIIVASALSLGSTISAFTWVPEAVEGTRNYMIEPALDAISSQTSVMAAMKHYDMRTDELAADVKLLQERLKDAQKYIDDHLTNSITSEPDKNHKQFLEQQMDIDRNELNKKMNMLQKASQQDQDILTMLARGTS